MKSKSFVILLLIVTLLAASCGGAKDKVRNENIAQRGRDKELYDEAMLKLRKGKYDEARLKLNVIITTYPDSGYLPLAKLAIADSFYREGGTSQLEQAIGGYKDFVNFFPTHPLACEVRLKIADSFSRQIIAYNRDWTKAKQAERQLLSCLESCQNSPLKPQIEERLAQVQQVLGLHELEIARFYQRQQAWKAVESRTRDIVANYQKFSYRDESLYLLGTSMIEQEQPEEAVQAFTELVRDIPNSQYAPKAKQFLEKLGKQIPEPSNNDPAPPRPGMMTKIALITGHNGLTISKDGVLIKEEGDTNKEAEKALQNASDSTGNAVRASSTGTTVSPSANNGTAKPGTTPNATPEGKAETKTDAKSEPKKDAKKDEGKKDDSKKDDNKKEKKKGLFGRIFR